MLGRRVLVPGGTKLHFSLTRCEEAMRIEESTVVQLCCAGAGMQLCKDRSSRTTVTKAWMNYFDPRYRASLRQLDHGDR
jgi:hypothetical protein